MEIKDFNDKIRPFNKNEVNEDLLHESVMREAVDIFKNEKARKGRTAEEVYNNTEQGHIAEQWLIHFADFENDTEKYMDVKYKGQTVEVKTSVKHPDMDQYIKELNKKRTTGMNTGDYVLSFKVDGDIYTPIEIGVITETRRKEEKFVIFNEKKAKKVGSPGALFNSMEKKFNHYKAVSIMRTYGYDVVE